MGLACKLQCKTGKAPAWLQSTSCSVSTASACAGCMSASGKTNGVAYNCAFVAPATTRAGVSCTPVCTGEGVAPSWITSGVTAGSAAQCVGAVSGSGTDSAGKAWSCSS